MTEFLVECDKCGHQFMLTSERVSAKYLENIGYVHYFDCPDCGFKYDYMIEDEEQCEYFREIEALQKTIEVKRNRRREISQFTQKRFQKLLEKSQKHQAVLRDKYKKVVTDQLNQSDIETNS